jgi:amidase
MAPDAGEGWGGLSTGHVVCCSVRDSALMLDCTAGPEPGDPYAAPGGEQSCLKAIARPPRKLRIALMLKDHRGAKLHPERLAAVENAAKLCASLGHTVEEADPELDLVALRPLNARISAANTARSCNMRWRTLGREPNPDDVEAVTWAVYQRGMRVSGVEYIEAMGDARDLGRDSTKTDEPQRLAGELDALDTQPSAGPHPAVHWHEASGRRPHHVLDKIMS